MTQPSSKTLSIVYGVSTGFPRNPKSLRTLVVQSAIKPLTIRTNLSKLKNHSPWITIFGLALAPKESSQFWRLHSKSGTTKGKLMLGKTTAQAHTSTINTAITSSDAQPSANILPQNILRSSSFLVRKRHLPSDSGFSSRKTIYRLVIMGGGRKWNLRFWRYLVQLG